MLHLKTNKSLSNMFTKKDIEKDIQNLDSEKAHDLDMISMVLGQLPPNTNPNPNPNRGATFLGINCLVAPQP